MSVKPSIAPRAWQRMLSGRRLDLLDPSPLDIELSDIAHGLARVARWNGQTVGDHAFSVAQHSVCVAHIFKQLMPDAPPSWSLAALLHDAPEYVIGDMISPFKATLGEEYKTVESRLQQAIHLRFSLPALLPEKLASKIKQADRICAYFEAIHLAKFEISEAAKIFGRPRGFSVDKLELEPLSTMKSQHAFQHCFETLEHAHTQR